MNSKGITFYTIAYNAEKTISHTIESVLNQTYKDFLYIIRDNGSTDKTFEIISQYAKTDKRIKIIRNEVNGEYGNKEVVSVSKPDSKYFSFLDSDDCLDREFASIMISEAEKNEADIVVCGSLMFRDGQYGQFSGERKLNSFIYKKGKQEMEFADLATLYGQLRPLWAKIYNVDFLYTHAPAYDKADDIIKLYNRVSKAYDTVLSLYLASKANNLVAIDKNLHYYQKRDFSDYISKRPDSNRIYDGILIYELGIELFKSKDLYKDESVYFLKRVFLNHIRELNEMLLNSKICAYDFNKKYLSNFFLCEKIIDIANIINYENLLILFNSLFEKLYKEKLNDAYSKHLSFDWTELFIIARMSDKSSINRKLLLMASVFYKTNIHRFAYNELFDSEDMQELSRWYVDFMKKDFEDQIDLFVDFKEYIKSTIDVSTNNKLNEYKVLMLDCVDANDIPKALEVSNQILSFNPLDREALYFKCLIAESMKLTEILLETKAIISIYYKNDQDMLEIL